MSFQTYTCTICGKEGLSKRQTYAVKGGRACREHEEACKCEAARAADRDETIKAIQKANYDRTKRSNKSHKFTVIRNNTCDANRIKLDLSSATNSYDVAIAVRNFCDQYYSFGASAICFNAFMASLETINATMPMAHHIYATAVVALEYSPTGRTGGQGHITCDEICDNNTVIKTVIDKVREIASSIIDVYEQNDVNDTISYIVMKIYDGMSHLNDSVRNLELSKRNTTLSRINPRDIVAVMLKIFYKDSYALEATELFLYYKNKGKMSRELFEHWQKYQNEFMKSVRDIQMPRPVQKSIELMKDNLSSAMQELREIIKICTVTKTQAQ